MKMKKLRNVLALVLTISLLLTSTNLSVFGLSEFSGDTPATAKDPFLTANMAEFAEDSNETLEWFELANENGLENHRRISHNNLSKMFGGNSYETKPSKIGDIVTLSELNAMIGSTAIDNELLVKDSVVAQNEFNGHAFANNVGVSNASVFDLNNFAKGANEPSMTLARAPSPQPINLDFTDVWEEELVYDDDGILNYYVFRPTFNFWTAIYDSFESDIYANLYAPDGTFVASGSVSMETQGETFHLFGTAVDWINSEDGTGSEQVSIYFPGYAINSTGQSGYYRIECTAKYYYSNFLSHSAMLPVNTYLSVSDPIVKTVTVGAQNGLLIEGTAGSVTYPITTTGIAVGTYDATVSGMPAGVSVSGQVTIDADGIGTLALAGSSVAVAGTTSDLTLSIDGTTSNTFSLTISPIFKMASVGAQDGTLTAGTEGTVTYPVTTANITNGSYNVSVANLPEGVSVQGQVVINNNFGTLTLVADDSTAAGITSTLTLTIDGTTSDAFSLEIGSAPKAVDVGAQIGTLTTGVAGTVTFFVMTENIADGNYTVLVDDLPAGVSVQGQVNIEEGFGALILEGSAAITAGTTELTLIIDNIESPVFTLTISEPIVKTVTVGEQNGTMIVGRHGQVSFPVTTENIDKGRYTVSVTNLPVGVSVLQEGEYQIDIDIDDNFGILVLEGSASTIVGTFSTLILTIDGVASNTFSLTISPTPKTVSVGSQIGALTAGIAGMVTFPVTTDKIANGTYTAILNSAPTGITTANITINNNNGVLSIRTTTAVRAGSYSLTVMVDGALSNNFTLTVNPSSGVPTNTTPDTASLISETLYGTLFSERANSYNRWYKFTTTGTKKISITFFQELNGDYDILLAKQIGADYYWVAESQLEGTSMEHLTYDAGAGNYLLCIVAYRPATVSYNYEFMVNVISNYDQHEPNDFPYAATPFTNYMNITANIDNPYDMDFYKFTSAVSRTLEIRISNAPAGNQYAVYVYNSSGNLMGNFFANGNTYRTTAVTPGDYYVEVESYTGEFGPNYTLSVKGINATMLKSGHLVEEFGIGTSNHRMVINGTTTVNLYDTFTDCRYDWHYPPYRVQETIHAYDFVFGKDAYVLTHWVEGDPPGFRTSYVIAVDIYDGYYNFFNNRLGGLSHYYDTDPNRPFRTNSTIISPYMRVYVSLSTGRMVDWQYRMHHVLGPYYYNPKVHEWKEPTKL